MTEEGDKDGELFEEIGNVRLSAAVIVRGSAAAIDRFFRDAKARPDLRVVYQKASAQRLRVSVDGEARP